MLFQGNKSLLMYATFRDSKGIVDYLLRVEGFNSLTDTDEVRSYYYVYFCYCYLSLSLGEPTRATADFLEIINNHMLRWTVAQPLP